MIVPGDDANLYCVVVFLINACHITDMDWHSSGDAWVRSHPLPVLRRVEHFGRNRRTSQIYWVIFWTF